MPIQTLTSFWARAAKAAAGVLVCVAAAAASPAWGKDRIVIDINNPNLTPYPIAVVNPKIQPDSLPNADIWSDKFGEIVRADLQFSGYFRVIDPKSYVGIEKEGLTDATIEFANWVKLQGNGLVKAGLKLQRNQALSVELHLFDVQQGKLLLSKTLKGSVANGGIHGIAHKAADEIYSYFVNEPPVFSTQIAYVAKLEKSHQIRIMDYDGNRDSVAVRDGFVNILPKWSPDAKELLYVSYRLGNPDLWRLNLQTNKSEVVSSRPGINVGGAYSADGKRIALTLSNGQNSDVYVMERNGKNLQRLTEDPAIDCQPSWSPDGKRIAFVSNRSGAPHIYIMNADGSSPARMTFQGDYNQIPKWSPRGDKIAFAARDERKAFDIFLLDPESKNISRLTQDQGFTNVDPTWSPNGRYLAFVSDRGGSEQIYIMNADGSNQRRITNKKWRYTNPAWGPLPQN